MSGDLDLEQRYRRVLRLLPRYYRDTWEEDMVAAFLDGWMTGDPDEDSVTMEYGRRRAGPGRERRGDRRGSAVHPDRFRAFATLPTSDPQAAAAELERCATQLGHVGAMVFGRTGDRPLDDPAYDDLFATAARWRQPVFIHPQIPSGRLRDAAYRGIDPLIDLGLATFGWGWHLEAGLSALRLILRGTFDRHPDLQLVLGHWGEMLLFWMDRADSLSRVAKHLERRVSDYIRTNIYITSSGMLQQRLLRHSLDFTAADRLLFSTDYPFHQPGEMAIEQFFDAIPDPEERDKIAYANAEALFRLS